MEWNPLRWFRRRGELGLEAPRPLALRPGSDRIALSVPAFDRWARIQTSVTPSDIAAIFAKADRGYPASQCDLYDDMRRRDGHLRSVLYNRMIAVAGKPWIVQAGGDSAEDVKAAELLERALRDAPMRDTMTHQLQSAWHGYSATEIVWDVRDGLLVPAWFASVPHRRIRFDEKDRPRLLTEQEPIDGVELEPGKWIFSVVPGRIAASEGIMRTATWWSYFKKLSVRDWLVFSERFGIPYVTGQWDESASEADKGVIKEAVASIGKDGWAAFSKSCEIVMHAIQVGGKAEDVQGALTSLCNAEISKLVLGATLTTGEGQSAGSFALGRVHQDARFDIVQGDEQMLGDTFERDVGRPFVEFNGLKARPPRLKVYVTRDVDPLTEMKILSIAANELGMEIDGEQVRQRFHIKKPRGGGEVLKGSRAGGEGPSADGAEG